MVRASFTTGFREGPYLFYQYLTIFLSYQQDKLKRNVVNCVMFAPTEMLAMIWNQCDILVSFTMLHNDKVKNGIVIVTRRVMIYMYAKKTYKLRSCGHYNKVMTKLYNRKYCFGYKAMNAVYCGYATVSNYTGKTTLGKLLYAYIIQVSVSLHNKAH